MLLRFTGLLLGPFQPLFGLSDGEFAKKHALRLAAEPSFPCRVTLEDAEPGEPVLLLGYEHQPTGPYRSSGPIFVREDASATRVTDRVPESFRPRLFSARAYDAEGMMVDAEIAEGEALEPLLERLLARPEAAYVHLHHARRGCFACRVDRAGD